MQTKSKILVAIIAVVLLSVGSVTQDAMAAQWQIGKQATANANTKELASHVNVPNLPSTSAEPNTVYWIGGDSVGTVSGVTHNFLNQPIIRAWSSSFWKPFFEVYDNTAGADAETQVQTNINMSPSQTATLDILLTAGQSCQTATDVTTTATASHCFSANNYGSSVSDAQAVLESVDSVSSDFHSMDGTISYTMYNGYVSGVAYSPVFNTAINLGAPTCMSASGGTGTASITLTNC